MEFSSSFVLFSHFILALQWFPVLAAALPTYFVFHLENTVSQLCNVTSLKKKKNHVIVTWYYGTYQYLSHDITVRYGTCHMTLQYLSYDITVRYGTVPVTWHYVPVSQQYFWWAVLQSPTEGVEEFSRLHVGCTSEVNQLQMEATIQNNVFVLNSWSTEHLDMTGAYDQTNRPYQQKEQGH